MAAVYPGSLASIPNAAADDTPGNAAGVGLAALLVQLADELEAVQAKVGVDASGVTTSIDYLLKSLSSLDPGHVHSGAVQHSDAGDVTIDSTVTTSETALRTFTVPADSLRVGDVLHVKVFGVVSRSTPFGPTLRIRLRWDGIAGTILGDTTFASASAAGTNILWVFEAYIHVRAIGGSGSVHCQAEFRNAGGSGSTFVRQVASVPSSGTDPAGSTGTVTIATNAATTLVLSAQHSANTAGNIITSTGGYAEIIRKAA